MEKEMAPAGKNRKGRERKSLQTKPRNQIRGVGRSWDGGFEQQGEGKWDTEKAGRECVMRFGDSGMCIF